MSRVLVVDDEHSYRESLAFCLGRQGDDVQTAASGREAIDLGVHFRPDVLVADWMLKNHMHGLHVSEVLRVVRPDLRTVLITGFASGSLRSEAGNHRVFDFIEKPFEPQRIQRAVRQAASTSSADPPEPRLAVAEIADHLVESASPRNEVSDATQRAGETSKACGATGSFLFANSRARDLFAQTRAGRDVKCFSELFSAQCVPDLDAAVGDWIIVRPQADPPVVWQIRSRRPGPSGRRLMVLRAQDEPQHLNTRLANMLLGCEEVASARWTMSGRVLVVDADELGRRFLVSTLEAVGAGCCGVDTHREALRLFEHDDGFRLVVLDSETAGGQTEEIITALRRVRQSVVIVGCSAHDRRDDFLTLGADAFVAKPVLIGDLCERLRELPGQHD